MDNETAESELESFRQKWRQEVSARSKGQGGSSGGVQGPVAGGPAKPIPKVPPPSSARLPQVPVDDDAYDGSAFHDLEDKEEVKKLGNETSRSTAVPSRGPVSALEHYEKAVERETQGSLGDSVNHYRKAFKLDARVQEKYKKKYFSNMAAQPSRPANTNPSNAAATVPNTAHHSLHSSSAPLSELLDEFSKLSVPPVAAPETSIARPRSCYIANVPEEVLIEILLTAALSDVADSCRLAQVCKRFAYLIMTEDRIWKRLSLGNEFGIGAMHYRYLCDIPGTPLTSECYPQYRISTAPAVLDLTPSVYPTYRGQFRNRPRLRFNGCYISTVNYTRPGGASQSAFTWNNLVHIVTYYRYLRFFRDGRVISLLTTAEPADVVHYLSFENMHSEHGTTLPSSVMKDALKGRWRLSGSSIESLPEIDTFSNDQGEGLEENLKGPGEYALEPQQPDSTRSNTYEEVEGDLHVETEGVTPKYFWKMHFTLGSSGRKEATRNNKLTWKAFWSYNRITDDWGDFRMKNERGFYWSRVKSYAL